MPQANKKLKLIKALIRRRFQTIAIDPAWIGFLQYPEFRDSQRVIARPKTRALAGDWDREIGVKVYWCSVYESVPEISRGMVPLHNYAFYEALQHHFVGGRRWQETEWYQWMLERQQASPVRRYETPWDMEQRLDLLDSLYQQFIEGNYRNDPVDRPIVNIGRGGRIALEDGRHRLCVARVAGVKEIQVDVNVIHDDSQWLAEWLTNV